MEIKPDPKTFLGVKLEQMFHFEKCFEVNVNILFSKTRWIGSVHLSVPKQVYECNEFESFPESLILHLQL